MRAYSTVQQLLCHGGYCELILSLARTSCWLLFTARPTVRPLAGNPLRDAVRSRNPLAHDVVATAVLHKHHPIIRVGAGLIHFVYRSHLRLVTEVTRNRNAFSLFFARVFIAVADTEVERIVGWNRWRLQYERRRQQQQQRLWAPRCCNCVWVVAGFFSPSLTSRFSVNSHLHHSRAWIPACSLTAALLHR